MFIKKDLRKITTILADAADNDNDNDASSPSKLLLDLRLQKRKAEFKGSVKILCQPSNRQALSQLQSLSLYDCEIQSLQGIGMLTTLQTLNVGRNPLTTVPDDLSNLRSLQSLWLDDCSFEGEFPAPILKLTALRELRLSNNRLTNVPCNINILSRLAVLGLDNNRLTEVPNEIQRLQELTTLLLRSNLLTELPNWRLPNLQVLHCSSNQLTALPDTLVHCRALTHLYANSNRLTAIPTGLDLVKSLQRINLSHNLIDHVPTAFLETFGRPDANGVCVHDQQHEEEQQQEPNQCTVWMRDNPVLTQFAAEKKEDNPMDVSTPTETLLTV